MRPSFDIHRTGWRLHAMAVVVAAFSGFVGFPVVEEQALAEPSSASHRVAQASSPASAANPGAASESRPTTQTSLGAAPPPACVFDEALCGRIESALEGDTSRNYVQVAGTADVMEQPCPASRPNCSVNTKCRRAAREARAFAIAELAASGACAVIEDAPVDDSGASVSSVAQCSALVRRALLCRSYDRGVVRVRLFVERGSLEAPDSAPPAQ